MPRNSQVLLLSIFIAIYPWGLTHGQTLQITPEENLIRYSPDENFMVLEQELMVNPQDVDLLLKRMRLRMYYGMDTEASEDIKMINSLNPYALYLHGFYGSNGYLEVIEMEPKEALIELSLAQRMRYYRDYFNTQVEKQLLSKTRRDILEKAIIAIEARRFNQALEILNAFNDRYPDLAIGHDLISVVYTELGQYDIAIERLSDAIALDPEYATAWYNFGRVERLNGRFDHALDYFDEAISIRANLSKAYFERALVNKELENLKEAEKDYTMIIEKDTLFSDVALQNRGLARKMSGDFEGALTDLTKAIEEYPENAALYKNRGNLFLLLGQLDQAMLDFNQAIDLDINNYEAYYNRGLTHYIMGNETAACDDLRLASDHDFERARVKYDLFCR